MNTKILVRLKAHLFKDQIGNPVLIGHTPQRIVSLVPSITTLLFDLGLGNRVVGVTKFCMPPEAWKNKITIAGGTKNLHLKKIISLQPDLILANKEENIQEQVEALAQHVPVYTSDVQDLDTALQMIKDIGLITQTQRKADAIIKKIEIPFSKLKKINPPKKCIYLIWQNPYYTIGGDTFISDMLQRAGLVNLYAGKKRYPELDLETIQKKKPDYVFLSNEPYPFREKHQKSLAKLLPAIKIILVDGAMFSWYGSHLIKTVKYLKKLQIQILSETDKFPTCPTQEYCVFNVLNISNLLLFFINLLL